VALLVAGASGLTGCGAKSICSSNSDCSPTDACVNGTCITTTQAESPFPTIPLTGCGLTGYLAPVTIGSGSMAQTFQLGVDTGSSTTAVAAAGCTTCTDVSPLFTPGGTTQPDGASASAQYGDGSQWSGTTVSDLIQVPPATPPVRTIFAQIEAQKSFFHSVDCSGNAVSTSPSQGILGLGPPDLLSADTQDFVAQFATASGLPAVFSVQLCPLGKGHLWLGGFDPSYVSAAPQYTPIPAGSQYWEVGVTTLSLQGTLLLSSTAAVLDTGTTINLLPKSAYQGVLSAFQSNAAFAGIFGSSGFQDIFVNGDCDAPLGGQTRQEINAQLPVTQIAIPAEDGSGDFTLDVPATGLALMALVIGGQTLYCSGVRDSTGLGFGDRALLGDVFLSTYVTVFDSARGRVGLAPETQCD
jgi:hypothetical protein